MSCENISKGNTNVVFMTLTNMKKIEEKKCLFWKRWRERISSHAKRTNYKHHLSMIFHRPKKNCQISHGWIPLTIITFFSRISRFFISVLMMVRNENSISPEFPVIQFFLSTIDIPLLRDFVKRQSINFYYCQWSHIKKTSKFFNFNLLEFLQFF